MSPFGTLLRCLLIVTLCLEGSLSLWSSSAMAVERIEHLATASPAPAVEADEDCDDGTSREGSGASHDDCDCGSGSGCLCACAFPLLAVTHTVPFAAQHLLASQPAVLEQTSVALATTARVFRPPIG